MLRDAVNAFVDHDSADVRSVIERDDEVNKLQDSLFRAIRAHMPEQNLSACSSSY